MLLRYAFAAAVLGAAMFAQSTPPPCPAERPVNDIIAEIQKQQSKKNNRNKNPFPTSICIAGWCRGSSKTPPTVPEGGSRGPQPTPSPESPGAESSPASSSASAGVSSSKSSTQRCNDAMERLLDAAHNVEVGDYYFGERNYNAARMRYSDAVEEKPDDPAIYVRLGRVFEKLNQPQQAIEQYGKAQQLDGPEKWRDEAKTSLARLRGSSGT